MYAFMSVYVSDRERECVKTRGNDVLVRAGPSLGVIHHNETAEGQSHQSASTTAQHRQKDRQ